MGRVAVAAIVSLWVIPTSILVNHIIPDPYMDETFHVPQAQQYCKGNFRSWDPMITTPPGLYYLSLAYVACLFPGMSVIEAASSFSELCSAAILRSFNSVLAVFCSVLVYEIITHLRPTLDERKATLYAVVLALYPLHWFFTFLYYTDVASVAAVLAMHLACLKKKYWFSALLGGLAVVIRQTNVIWMLFVCCCEVINITLAGQRDKIDVDGTDFPIREKRHPTSTNSVPLGSNLRKRKANSSVDTGLHFKSTRKVSFQTFELGFFDEVMVILLKLWQMKLKLLVSFSPFILVLAAFIAFVRWNGSVVLGAKEAHAVSPHFAQIMYFGLFSALAMAPMLCNLSQVVGLFRSMWKNKFLTFFQMSLALGAGFIAVHFFRDLALLIFYKRCLLLGLSDGIYRAFSCLSCFSKGFFYVSQISRMTISSVFSHPCSMDTQFISFIPQFQYLLCSSFTIAALLIPIFLPIIDIIPFIFGGRSSKLIGL